MSGALIAMLLLAGQAAAHVEVTADPAQAGAQDVTVAFTVEAESDSAGIQSLQVRLPDQVSPADVTWIAGPTAWSMSSTADGYTTTGPAIPAGEDARYSIKIRKLPNTAMLVFKTLVTYTNGPIDRWIDLPGADGAEPEHPAPTVTLAPAAAVAPDTGSPAPQAQPTAPAADNGLPVVAWVALAVLVTAIVVFAVVLILRRRTRVSTHG